MTIDWFTVVAQIINFVVLVFLLYRLLYGPIMKAMQQREERIAARLRDAEALRQQADQEAAAYQQKRAEFDRQHDELLAAMQTEIDERQKQLLETARTEVDELKKQWEQALRRDRKKFVDELARRTAAEVFAIARRALADIADTALEEHAAKAFLQQVQTAARDEWLTFTQSLPESHASIVVRSAFELPDELRDEIEQALMGSLDDDHNQSDRKIHVHFTRDPKLIAGIELQAHSRIAAWNLDDYLQAMEDRVSSLLDAESESSHGVAPDSDAD